MYRIGSLFTLAGAISEQPFQGMEQIGLLQKMRRGQIKATDGTLNEIEGTGFHEKVGTESSVYDVTTTTTKPLFVVEVGGHSRGNYAPTEARVDRVPELAGKTVHVWPEALVSYRCTNESDVSCSPCGGGVFIPQSSSQYKNCWVGMKGEEETKEAMIVKTTGFRTPENPYLRYQAKFYVRCAQSASLHLRIKDMKKGKLSLFVNGVDKFSMTKKTSANKFQTIALPATSDADLHTVVLQFVPSGKHAKVEMGDVLIFMDPKFAECEEFKMCLAKMLSADAQGVQVMTAGGMKLRNDQSLQLRCLTETTDALPDDSDEHEGLQDSCQSWRKCVESTGRRDELLAILTAATKTLSTTTSWATNLQLLQTSSPLTCTMPTNMDPEAWDCNCHESMKTKCAEVNHTSGYSQSLCFQALMCNADKVCAEWKDYNCPDPANGTSPPAPLPTVWALQQELSAAVVLQQRLQQRATKLQSREATFDEVEDLDATLSDKQC